MSFISYAQINSLEEFPLIAGTNFTLKFIVYEDDGVTLLDMGGATIYWVLCPYGQPDYAVAQLSGTITSIGHFEVEITSSTTRNLSGKYIHQPVIISFLGDEYRPGQGIILIQPQIPVT
jgi:hypothetical protein